MESKIIKQICLTNTLDPHDKPITLSFDKIPVNKEQYIKNIYVRIKLPILDKDHDYIPNYKTNLFGSLKIVGNRSFLYNNNDLVNVNNDCILDDAIYIPIKPYKEYDFNLYIFENAYTELILRPYGLLYIGTTLKWKPEVSLYVELNKLKKNNDTFVVQSFNLGF
jgi:hypothetical protein